MYLFIAQLGSFICMAWMLMHHLDIIYIGLVWFDYYKHVICTMDVLNALYTIYIESVYYIYGVIIGLTYIFIWVHVRAL